MNKLKLLTSNQFKKSFFDRLKKQWWQIHFWKGIFLRLIFLLKWKVHKQGNYLMFQNKNIKLIQPNIGVLFEDLNHEYHLLNFKNRRVLDIGSLFGETAVFFKNWGANKVICVEPLKSNVEFIRKNLKLNKVNGRIINAAVSNKDGYETWKVDKETINWGEFGLKKGEYKVKIKTISWKRILEMAEKEKIDVIKVDCEGCERYLTEVDKKLIKYFKYWIIEVHSNEIEREILKLFRNLKFKNRLVSKAVNNEVKLYYFWR